MESKKKTRSRRSFTREPRAEIANLCLRDGRWIRQVARDFNLSETAVRESLKRSSATPAPGPGRPDHAERDEPAQLRRA